MTWNQNTVILLWLTLLLMKHCLRYRHGGEMEFIAVLWSHRIKMSLPSKLSGALKSFPESKYSHTVSLLNG